MEFWNSLLTEKSWNILQEIKGKFDFILIGGWASYLWTKTHKSKDIDIIIDLKTLYKIKNEYKLIKNDRLKKYENKFGEIDVDIYAPYYSKLSLPIEDLGNYFTTVEGFKVVIPEILLILKQGAELDRGNSIKGQKDRIDIMSLLFYSDIDFKKYNEIIKKYNLNYAAELKRIIKGFKDLKHLNTNAKDFKKIKNELLEKIGNLQAKDL